MRPLTLISLIFAFAVSSCSGNYAARVIGVSDGDSITVLRGRTPVRIRLHGVDAPETTQDFGKRAKQIASDLAIGKRVTIQPRDKDRYQRTVAEVILPDGRSLNHELVRQGAAWWYRQYAPGDRELARLESQARGARRGLWSQPRPTPPWDWRKESPRSQQNVPWMGRVKSLLRRGRR